VVRDKFAGPASLGSGELQSRRIPPHLSIVVLPFANLGGAAEQDYLVDGVTESLTTDLSRISGSFVIGRHTAFTYKGRAVDLKKIGQELNVRYVLEGSVQRHGNRLRVNVQLVDAETGAHLWFDRFDKPVANLFDMQDEIVSRLANTLDARLTEEEARRSARSLNPNSMDLYFQGRALCNKSWAPECLGHARRLFERAVALDCNNDMAEVWTAGVDLLQVSVLMACDRAAVLAAAETKLLKALSVQPHLAIAHHALGAVLHSTNRIAGIAEHERALALDPNMARE
jgi:TolB-like protein